jgi:hypothetical protein
MKTNAERDKLSNRQTEKAALTVSTSSSFKVLNVRVPPRLRGTGQTVDNRRVVNLGNGAEDRKEQSASTRFPQRDDRP